MLRMKLVVQSVKRVADSEGAVCAEEIALHAVYGNNNANAQWSKYTPAASLTASITNPDAFGRVLPGQYVFLDLSPAGKDD